MPIAVPVSQAPIFIPVPTPVPVPAPVFAPEAEPVPLPAPAPRPTGPLPGRLTDTGDVDRTYHDPDVARFGGIVDRGDYLHMGPNSPVEANKRHIPAGHVTDWNPEGKAVVISPIALDLDGDGRISTSGNSTAKERVDNHVGSTVQFDLDADGKTDQVEWLSGGKDGFLVDTREIAADGSLNGKALFGDMGGKFSDGFQKLAQLDSDQDGQLIGNELNSLGVWVDNGNGRLDAGELKSLSELKLSQLSTQRKDETNARGETLMRSTANNGSMMSEDVWLTSK